jgi:hypothetical protein
MFDNRARESPARCLAATMAVVGSVAQEVQHGGVENGWVLQHRKMTHVGQDYQPSAGYRGGEVAVVFWFDAFVVLAVGDGCWDVDGSQLIGCKRRQRLTALQA